MLVLNHRLKSSSRISRPSQLSGSDQVTIETAVAGDIIGIASNGSFQINDTISTTKGGFRFKPLPQFQPEFFARIRPKEVSGRKSFDKGCEQLSNEGAILLLKEENSPDPIFAAVGRLQFEVLEWRLKDEYNVETTITPLSFQCSAWLVGDLKTFKKNTTAIIAFDLDKRPIVLFQSTWEKEYAIKQNPNHKLVDILES
jgi:peptide chain release factor 3